MRWKTVAVVALVVLMTGFIFSLEVTSPSKVSVKPLQILYSTFNGSTTNFDSFNQSFLYNLPGVILEKTLFGKVAFNSPLNIVAMAGPDWIVNFDRDLNISNNLINVDNYNLPGINKSANLSINNISVPNPVIYNKGVVCNSCNLISYLNGTVRFSTPLFSGPYYILQNSSVTYCGDGLCNGNETYATCPTDCQSTCGNGVWFYCNDTSGNWGSNYTNFSIDNSAAIAISFSNNLSQYIKWNVVTLPAVKLDAEGNNLNGTTSYYVNISAVNTLVDLYVKANGDLTDAALDTIGLGNETYKVSLNDSTVTNGANYTMSTNYTKIASGIGGNNTLYMKFYLDAPVSQPAGEYLNQLSFKAVRKDQVA